MTTRIAWTPTSHISLLSLSENNKRHRRRLHGAPSDYTAPAENYFVCTNFTVACEWQEHLNERIFNRSKIRPFPCEHSLSQKGSGRSLRLERSRAKTLFNFLKEWTDLTKLADSGCYLVIDTNGYLFFKKMFILLLCNDLFQVYILSFLLSPWGRFVLQTEISSSSFLLNFILECKLV